LAKVAKEKIGVDFLINGGWNLSEAEAEFGQNWLVKKHNIEQQLGLI